MSKSVWPSRLLEAGGRSRGACSVPGAPGRAHLRSAAAHGRRDPRRARRAGSGRAAAPAASAGRPAPAAWAAASAATTDDCEIAADSS